MLPLTTDSIDEEDDGVDNGLNRWEDDGVDDGHDRGQDDGVGEGLDLELSENKLLEIVKNTKSDNSVIDSNTLQDCEH